MWMNTDNFNDRLTALLATGLTAALLTSASALADDHDAAPISAERPGFSSSPIALAPSVWQLEAGYQYSRNDRPDVDVHTLPLALLRYGMTDMVELQISWPGYTTVNTPGRDFDGATDASIGVKIELNGADAVVPLALYAGASLPIGSDRFSSDEVIPTLGLFWSYDPGVALFGTALVASDDGDLSLGNAVGISLPVSDETSAFVEYFGLFADGAGAEHYLNGGFAWLYRNHVQLDLHAGAGLNSRATDFFLGLGVAYRF